MELKDMIPGQIYCVKTVYKWLIRFKEFTDDSVVGYSRLVVGESRMQNKYSNAIKAHSHVREASLQEQQMYEELEKKAGYFPILRDLNYLIFN